jgi:hypothetical protein
MTTFLDGPAKGKTMMLRRAVMLLRVTRRRFALDAEATHQKDDVFDALDAPEDQPAAEEELFCYKNTGKRGGSMHVRYGGNKRHLSGFYVAAEYALYEIQPPDEVMRDTDKWRAWCETQRPALGL